MKHSVLFFLLLSAVVPNLAIAQPRDTGFSAEASYIHLRSSPGNDLNGAALELGLLLPLGSFAVGAQIGMVAGAATGFDLHFKVLNPFLGGYYVLGLPLGEL